MKDILCSLLGVVILISAGGCRQRDLPENKTHAAGSRSVAAENRPASAKLSKYWYQGKAEISSYDLSQNRYRDVHPGKVILVFVTEDFLTGKQVKDEGYGQEPSAKVLKTNMLHKFTTGLYDYSIMTSVFTPVDSGTYPFTFKVSSSSQDWCGQSYMQVNLAGEEYRMRLFSYFEREGDRDESLSLTILEDELFNRIRLDPAGLPVGQLDLLPSAMYCRLAHRPFLPQPALVSLRPYTGDQFAGTDLRAYRVEYPALQRTLEIVFEGEEPYIIAGWTDSFPSLLDGQLRTTVARRMETILDDYWRHNGREDAERRHELGL